MNQNRNPFEDFESEKPTKTAEAEIVEKVEEKPEPEPARQEEPKAKEAEPVEEKKPMVILTETDAYIHDRMKGQPKSLTEVELKVVESNKPDRHRLSLPVELEDEKKKYTFRWIFKSKRAIDEACDQKGWTLCNRSYFPDLPNHYFTANGSIERGDNILAFIPNKRAEEIRREPARKSREMIDSTFGKHKGDPNFYKPKDNDDDNVIMI